MLVLPAKASDPGGAIGFEYRDDGGSATHIGRLPVADVQQGAVGNRLDETCSQRVRRDSEGPNIVLDRYHFDHVRVSGTGVHERAPEGLEELTIEHMARTVLGHLARASGDDVLMALPAGLRVICGSKTIANGLHLFEDEPVVVEGPQRYDCVLVQRLEIGTLRVHSVRLIVESLRRFRWIVSTGGRTFVVHDTLRRELIPPVGPPPLRAHHRDHRDDEQEANTDWSWLRRATARAAGAAVLQMRLIGTLFLPRCGRRNQKHGSARRGVPVNSSRRSRLSEGMLRTVLGTCARVIELG